MGYIGAEPDGQGSAERFVFTATATTTDTVTHDDDGLAINYEANHVSVYLNGVKQVVGTDVTASNGSTLVFDSNLSENDVVECIALSSYSPADTVPASGGTFTGAVTLPSPVINTGVSGSAVLDSDTMSGASSTTISTSESIKAYVDASSTSGDYVSAANGGTFSDAVTFTTCVADAVYMASGSGPTWVGIVGNTNALELKSGGNVTMYMVANGDVGIGITPPNGDKLHVAGDIVTSTTGKVKQKGAFMQSSTHQALTLGY